MGKKLKFNQFIFSNIRYEEVAPNYHVLKCSVENKYQKYEANLTTGASMRLFSKNKTKKFRLATFQLEKGGIHNTVFIDEEEELLMKLIEEMGGIIITGIRKDKLT